MVKSILLSSVFLLGQASISFTSAQKLKQNNRAASKGDVKFLEDISINLAVVTTVEKNYKTASFENVPDARKEGTDDAVETASKLRLKYAVLLDAEVEQITNDSLFQDIDDWYGTSYVFGGTTKNGVDCSALVQALFSSHYRIVLPRTAREQYDVTLPVEKDDLREGDLLFFNTTGGVSHVGIYLQNNKFVHSATTEGVTISDVNESYWAKRFLGFRRYQKPENPAVSYEDKDPSSTF